MIIFPKENKLSKSEKEEIKNYIKKKSTKEKTVQQELLDIYTRNRKYIIEYMIQENNEYYRVYSI